MYYFCVCVKRKTLYLWLCSSSSCFSANHVRNIETSHIRISGIVMTWTAAFVVNSSSRQKTDLAISKNNVSVKLGLSLEKRCLWSCVLQCENWTNWSILTLLITNYSSVYSISLFYLSIYLSNYTLYQNYTLPSWRLFPILGQSFYVGTFLPHWRWPNKNPEQSNSANSRGVLGNTPD